MFESSPHELTAKRVAKAIAVNGEGKATMIGVNALVALALALVGAWQAGLILFGLVLIYVSALALVEPHWLAAVERGSLRGPYRQLFTMRTILNWSIPFVLVAAVAHDPRTEVLMVAFVTLLGGLTVDMTRALSARRSMWIYAAGPNAGLAGVTLVIVANSLQHGGWAWLGVVLSFGLLGFTVWITWSYMQGAFRRILDLRAEQNALIAQLTRANEEARLSKERLTTALESGETGVWEIALPEGEAPPSPFLTQLFGKPLTYPDMRSGAALTMIAPEDRERTSDLFARLHKAAFSEAIEHAAYLADGSIGYVRTLAQSFADDAGKVCRIVLSTTNITEKRRQELELSAMLSQAETALHRRRRLLTAMQGGAPETDSPRSEEDRPANLSAMRHQLAAVLAEMDIRDLALAKAVETVLEAQAKAEEASIAKSQFLANMSHELRTPLNAIIGYSEIVMEDLTAAATPAAIPDLERIRGAGKHLLSLINEVLDLSKIEAGRLDIHPEPCNAAAIARDAVETVEVIAARQGSVCELIIEAADTMIVSDPSRLKQCLLNLLSNAAKFTEKGRITLVVRSTLIGEAPGLAFDVKDTGIGISPDNLAKLFQPFVQVDGSRTRRAGGAGIGLVITKHLARLLGGDVTVESAVNVGSTFTLTVRTLTVNDDEVWIAA